MVEYLGYTKKEKERTSPPAPYLEDLRATDRERMELPSLPCTKKKAEDIPHPGEEISEFTLYCV